MTNILKHFIEEKLGIDIKSKRKRKVPIYVEENSFEAAIAIIEQFSKIKIISSAGKRFPLQWIEPDDNPFRERIFDCREYAFNRKASTKNKTIAAGFFESRASNGMEYVGQFPENCGKIEVNFNFHSKLHPRFANGLPDGPLFKASVMEEKWDIYKYGSFIFFTRSWTGELIYFSNCIPTDAGFKISLVVFNDSKIDYSDPFFDLRVVEYLVHSHVLGLQVPHPIPHNLEDNATDIANYSFSMFGNKGLFAAYK